jgi:protein tyrosine phosphatase (PTP) superfamily phosphohydrolase (DUF442 family)
MTGHHNVLQKKIFIPVLLLSLVLLILYYAHLSLNIQTVVEKRIYRSPQLSANSLEKTIKEKGIKTIINLKGEDKEDKWYIEESEISKKNNITLYDCRLSASDLPKYRALAKILNILLTSERPLLIHCAAGVDRTGFVSALALAIEKDLPLPELKKQFSWKSGVLRFHKSIGPQFFSHYDQWLDKIQRTHSKENLIHWINHEYVDGRGNLEFYIESINGKVRATRRKFVVPRNSKTVLIGGWVFDARTNSPVEGFHVVVDNRISIKANRHNRPGIAKFFSLKEYNDSFMVGWSIAFDKSAVGDGCHKISFRIVKNESSSSDLPTDDEFCFEDTVHREDGLTR